MSRLRHVTEPPCTSVLRSIRLDVSNDSGGKETLNIDEKNLTAPALVAGEAGKFLSLKYFLKKAGEREGDVFPDPARPAAPREAQPVPVEAGAQRPQSRRSLFNHTVVWARASALPSGKGTTWGNGAASGAASGAVTGIALGAGGG